MFRPFCCSSSQKSFGWECTWWRSFQKRVMDTKFDIYVFVPLCFHKGHLWLYLLNNHDKNGWYNGRTLKLGRLILYTVAFRLLVTYVMICHEFIQSNQFDSSKRVSIGQIKFFVYTGKKKYSLNGSIK